MHMMGKITVWCNGEDTHPKVYLKIPEGETKIVCPYCNKVFKKENKDDR